MLRIGLTGGIGSGKSLVCHLFTERGVPVIDTDEIAREVVAPGEPALISLSRIFGNSIIDAEGGLNRRKLREQVFQDNEKLAELEAIIHPLIRERMRAKVKHLSAPYVVMAIPLLLEKGWQNEVDRILVVDTTEELQLRRTIKRDQSDAETVSQIIKTQVSRDERVAAADDIIHNEENIMELELQVDALHAKYLSLAAAH